MKLLTEFFAIRKQIHEYFGYVEDWVTIPLQDRTDMCWRLDQDDDGSGTVTYAMAIEDMPESQYDETKKNYYEDQIYTQRFLPKWVYRAEDYTMISVDTQCDGNKFLAIFDNTKELPALVDE